jgi:hypothetical protein
VVQKRFEQLIVAQLIKKCLPFMELEGFFSLVGWDLRHQVLRPLLAYCTELEGSLLYSQEPANGPHPQSVQFRPQILSVRYCYMYIHC